jgi:ankyrin repeat domain-containing protein 13
MNWSEYINSVECPILGRPMVCKDSSKSFKATIAMSEDFPLTVDMLLSVLEVGRSDQETLMTGKPRYS